MTDGPTLFPEADLIKRTAIFSPCEVYRYTLGRVWDADLPRILFVLLNPSTADAERDDPTNRRAINFSKRWGYGSCVFVNLFAFRSPKPKVMKACPEPVGPENDAHISEQASWADCIVVAWGATGGHLGRDVEVLKLLEGRRLWCMGKTKAGHPKHPLYLANTTPLELFRG